MTIFRTLFLLPALVFTAAVPAALGQPAADIQTVTRDTPRPSSAFLRTFFHSSPAMPEQWLFRTGAKKGLRGAQLIEEMSIAPDIGVLAAGSSDPWQSLLAEMREPYVMVAHDGIAGTARTRPLLIIPTGALSGTAGSGFFRAALDAYVRAGGTIICFAQRSGGDYDVLPVPAGTRVAAAGWADDRGPLLARSALRAPHPAFARLARSEPVIETSGHLLSLPANSEVLLSRPDGMATLALYRHGAGRVVIASLFPDVLFAIGQLHSDERSLVQDLLLWAKAPAPDATAAPGDRLNFTLRLPDAPPADATLIKVRVFASSRTAPVQEQVFPAPSPKDPLSLPFSYVIPGNAAAGVYHLEYAYLDPRGKPLTAQAEFADGRFSVGRAPAAPPAAPAPLERIELAAPPVVRTALTGGEDSPVVTLELSFDPAPLPGRPLKLMVRAADVIRELTVTGPSARVDIPLGPRTEKAPVPVTVHVRDGGILYDEVIPVAPAVADNVFLEHAGALPGGTVRFRTRDRGRGELTVHGFGRSDSDIIQDNGSLDLPVPSDLPAGRYPVSWEFRSASADTSTGIVWINIRGYRVIVTGLAVEASSARGAVYAARAKVALRSSRGLKARVTLLRETDDESDSGILAEAGADIVAGQQELVVPFTFMVRHAGPQRILAVVSADLPADPGLPGHSLAVAEADTLFDAGNAAVLGIDIDRRVSYEPRGEVRVTAYIAGSETARLDLSMDQDRLRRTSVKLAGLQEVAVRVADPRPGAHSVQARLENGGPPSLSETTFLYGTVLPDLAVNIVTADPSRREIEIGLGIRNQGTAPAPATTAVLYDGDPDSGGRQIGSVEVPALLPGRTTISLLKWSIVNRTGERPLVALVDPRNRIAERDKRNNRSRQLLLIPDVLLELSTARREFGPREPIPVRMKIENLTKRSFDQLQTRIQLLDRSGKQLFEDSFPLTGLPAPGGRELDREIVPKDVLLPGTYVITALVSSGRNIVANTLQEIVIPPKLDLKASLEIAGGIVRQCAPLDLSFTITNTGNIPVTAGKARIELGRDGDEKPAFSKDVPLVFVPQQERVARLLTLPGRHSLRLIAWPENDEHGIRKEIVLAEQTLSVASPVRAEGMGTGFPRVLVWLGADGGARGRAAAEGLLRDSFDRQGIYFHAVSSQEDFVKQALSGMFNTLILLDVTDPVENMRWLRDFVSQGYGLIITGPDGASRSAAEAFGFSLDVSLAREGAVLQVQPSFGISGTFSAAGPVLLPQKRNTQELITAAGDGRPVALLDGSLAGKVLVLPFSLTRSVRESGAGAIYGLLLRAAVRTAASAKLSEGDFVAGGLLLSAPDGPITARAVVTLPPGASLVWTDRESDRQRDSIVTEQELDGRPLQLLYLFRPAPGGGRTPDVEVFFQCEGAWVSRGKVE